MASQFDNFRLYDTLYGLSPARMTFLLCDNGDGTSSIAANSAIVQGQVLQINTEGCVQPQPSSGAATLAACVGVAAWTGEANVAPIAQYDECPVVLAAPGNVFAVGYASTVARTLIGLNKDITESAGAYTIATTAANDQVNIVGVDTAAADVFVVFHGSVFAGTPAVSVAP